MKKYLVFFLMSGGICLNLSAQKLVSRNIHSFGAKGDGKTNDTEAFIKAAAFFNERHGNGTLLIPKGVYIVGRQVFNTGDDAKSAYEPVTILDFKNCENLAIKGDSKSILKYEAGLKLGSFDPVSGRVFNDNNPSRPSYKYAGQIGNCIALTNCKKITIQSLILDGNNKKIIFGGRYDDKGIQLQHVGIAIKNSQNIFIHQTTASYFGLDGMQIANEPTAVSDNIKLSNCLFEYNCRQGVSWVGGNFLKADSCKFNHTGQVAYFSSPGAGIDIEAEVGPISNGNFNRCEFVNNTGCGMLTGGGKSSNCNFNNCLFWGVNNWSIWVNAPAYTFTCCNIYGSIVDGYNAEQPIEATRFIRCNFEDKEYNGKSPFGRFLVECNNSRRILFDSCNFVAHAKEPAWIDTNNAKAAEERATITNSHFVLLKKTGENKPINYTSLNFSNNTTEFREK